MERIPASDRTREKLKALMEGRSEVGDGRSELVRLAARLIIEEALEGEARDALGRDYYARGATPGAGYRNGYRPGRVKSAEGAIAYSAPQIADRSEPFRSRIREVVQGRTEELEALAVEMYARGLSTRDIEAVFADANGRSLLSRTAVSEVTERLWAEYEAFAGRDLSEFEITYLFVDGIAERLHLGQPREAVLAAWGILADGKKALLHLAPGTKEDTASCKEFFQDLRRRGLPDPLLVASDGAPGMIRAIEECLPRSIRQRCLAHKMRNLQSKVPEDVWPEFKARAAACYQAASPALARLLRDDIATTYGPGSALGGELSRRRLGGVHRASAFPSRPSSGDPHYQSARAAVRRGAPAHQGDPTCLWRARRPKADVCRAHPCCRALAWNQDHRIRAASAEGNPRGNRQGFHCAQCSNIEHNGHRSPNPFIQQGPDLTSSRTEGARQLRRPYCLAGRR
jgi:putative transposase